MSTSIITASELIQKLKLNEPEPVCILDASWYLPSANRDPKTEFVTIGRIPGAVFFDIDSPSLCKTISNDGELAGLPHMLPDADQFARGLAQMRLKPGVHIVVYDTHSCFASPRVWWTFLCMGYDRVAVLDGGLPAWIAAGGDVVTGTADADIGNEEEEDTDSLYSAWKDVLHAPLHVLEYKEIADRDLRGQAWQADQVQVVDVRSAGRFAGTAPEPRPGLPSGHMPGSLNVPFTDLLVSGVMASPARLREVLSPVLSNAGVGIDGTKSVIVFLCGSGLSACIGLLAMRLIGVPLDRLALYDGSWVEWAQRAPADQIVGDTAM